MPGAEQLLLFMQQIEMQRILVTGSGQRSLIDRLERDFPGSFTPETMITAKDVTHGKPHPEPYLMAMKLAKVQPWQSVVIENAPLGVEAGDAAGAFTIGVTTGPIPRAELEKAGAAIVFDSMQELADQKAKLTGCVLNDTPAVSHSNRYGHGQYGYGKYGYGKIGYKKYGYGRDKAGD